MLRFILRKFLIIISIIIVSPIIILTRLLIVIGLQNSFGFFATLFSLFPVSHDWTQYAV